MPSVKEMSIDEKINDMLSRGVGEFIDPDDLFRKKLIENPEKVIIKFGVDPTRPDIHLGHAVVLRKLREFQDLGCKVVFLIGDYTAQIGDPTGKSKVRPEIQQAEVEENMKTYLEQVVKILKTDENVFSWIRNSDWFTSITDITAKEGYEAKVAPDVNVDGNSLLGKSVIFENSRMQKTHLKMKSNLQFVSLSGFLWALKHITHSRLIERDMFQNRINSGSELFMHEMMYPVLQGIDSYVLDKIYGSCDLEVGGTDQTFNMLVARDVMKFSKQKPQAVLAFKLLEGTDGKEKMSKSLNNYIGITDEPNDMYGKVMCIPDSSIVNYFELCTFTPVSEIENIKNSLSKEDVNPRDLKMNLARQIVAIYHGEEKATSAQEAFVKTFQRHEIPDEMDEVSVETDLVSALVENDIVKSKSEYRRLIEEGAITNLEKDEKITDAGFTPESGTRIKIGKRRFVKIK